MVFTTSEVMAQTQTYPPKSCAFGSPAVTITAVEPFPLAITSLGDDFNKYPCTKPGGGPCDFPYFVYAYEISNTSNISVMTQLFPVCPDPINILASSPAMNTPLPPGTPEFYGSKTYWPVGIYDSFAVSWTSNPSSGKFYVATKTPAVDTNSMAIKAGSNFYYCAGGIAGPGCNCGVVPAAMLPGNVYEEKRFGPFCLKVERDYMTWCAKKVTDCNTGEELLPTTDLPIGEQYLVQCGDGSGNQRCMECVIFTEASPGCIWYIVNGAYRKKCL